MGQLVTLASVGEENLPFAEDVLECYFGTALNSLFSCSYA